MISASPAKYSSYELTYSGAPSFIEEDMFTTVVHLAPVASETAGQVAAQVPCS